MNKIYKVIWSKTRNCYVAVSELAKNHGKNNVRSEARGVAKGASVLALSIALSLGVTGSAWADPVSGDSANIGTGNSDPVANSAVVGENNTASGKDSVAIGANSMALGDYSFAGGGNTIREVTGTGSYRDPYKISVSTLEVNTTASGYNSFAYGFDSHAVGDQSFAFGHGVTAGAEDSIIPAWWSDAIIIGEDGTEQRVDAKLQINGYAAAFGYKTAATGSGSFAAGLETKAAGKGTVALGYNTHAGQGFYGFYERQWTYDPETGTYGVILDTDNLDTSRSRDVFNNSYATAFGENTTAAGVGAVAFGQGGSFSDKPGYNSTNDTEDQDKHNPDIYYEYRPQTGRTGAYGDYSATFGRMTFAKGDRSVAMGSFTNAIGENSLAYGFQSYAIGKDSTAFGNSTWASGNRSTAFGSQTEAKGMDSLAFGIATKAYGTRSVAFGSHTLSTGSKSTSFGTVTAAQSENATAFGERTQASGKNALAFGHYSTTGVRYQSPEDKLDGIYTMTIGNEYSAYNQIKVKIEDKQFARVLTDYEGTAIKAQKDGKDYIVYYAHKNNYADSSADAGPTYAIKFRKYDANGNPGQYYYQEVAYNPETGEVELLNNIVKVGDAINGWKISLTDMGNEDDDATYERNKTPLYQYVMDESYSAKNAVAFGNDTNAQADNSLAFGDATVAGGKRSTAFGNHTVATGDSATSFGDATLASSRNSTAFGESSRATQKNATAYGQENAAMATNATAFGHKTKSTGDSSTTWGDESIAAGKYSTSFGEDSVAFAQDSVSWGTKAVAGISTTDQDYQDYIQLIRGVHEADSPDEDKSLVELENELKAAKKAGDIANTAKYENLIAQKENIITDFYNRHFLTDQSAVDKLNQATLDSLNQPKVEELNNGIKRDAKDWLTKKKGYANSYDELVELAEQAIQNHEYYNANISRRSEIDNIIDNDLDGQLDAYLNENNLALYDLSTLPEDKKITELENPVTVTDKVMGKNATAWGQNTNASGRAATAWGNKTIAAGANSTAWGNQSIAVGGDSTAFGKSSKAWVTIPWQRLEALLVKVLLPRTIQEQLQILFVLKPAMQLVP